jgi:hypothetical protein
MFLASAPNAVSLSGQPENTLQEIRTTMFRWLAFLFLSITVAVLAGDLYVALTGDGGLRLQALGEWWAWIHRDSLLLLQPAIERHISPALWDPGVQTILEWPAAVDFGVLAAVCWMLRKRPSTRRENLKFRR